MTDPISPYCGPPPLPGTLMQQWNADPLVLAPVAACLLYGAARRRPAAGMAAAFLFLAFVSPLCALASALFSARVLHHVVLVGFAAPMLALLPPRRAGAAGPLWLPFALHTGLMWLWHAPQPYLWALSSDAAYWAMELTLLGSAVWVWRGILGPGRAMPAVGLALAVMIQMGFLGALLVFAANPLYAAHLTTTEVFGLSPLEDQQLAGVLMWAPAALPYIAAALWRIWPLVAGDARAAGAAR